MKKLVAAMLVLVLVLCAFAAYGEEGDGLPEKELGDGSTTLLVYVASGSVDTDALFSSTPMKPTCWTLLGWG